MSKNKATAQVPLCASAIHLGELLVQKNQHHIKCVTFRPGKRPATTRPEFINPTVQTPHERDKSCAA